MWFSTARRDATLHDYHAGIGKRNKVQAARSVCTQKRSSGEPSCLSVTFCAHGQKMRQCAGRRCHHFLHTVPSPFRGCASGHDIGMQQVMSGCWRGCWETSDSMKLQGCEGGIWASNRPHMVPAACWTSWADALTMLETRLSQVVQIVATQLNSGRLKGCNRGGFVTRPTWSELRAGTRPTSVSSSEFGEAGTVGSVPFNFSLGGT